MGFIRAQRIPVDAGPLLSAAPVVRARCCSTSRHRRSAGCALRLGQPRGIGFAQAPLDSARYTLDVQHAALYRVGLMIKSFRDRATEHLWMGAFVRRFSGIDKQAVRKLDMLHHARSLIDLRPPPANRLEALSGDRRGQHSIRINDQWRICCTWSKEGPSNVEIVDYH